MAQPDTIGSKCVSQLKAAKKAGPVPWTKVAEIIDGVASAERFTLEPDSTPEPKEKKRNVLIDGIMTACGYDPLKATSSAIRTAAVALAEIKKVYADITPAELNRLAKLYHRKHPTWEVTPSALAAHLHEFKIRTHEDEIAAKLDPYNEPANWRDLAIRAFGDISWPENWSDISSLVRTDILRKTQTR